MNFAALPERLAQVRAEIARCQAAGGWTRHVTIVAVTKGFGPDAVTAAFDGGLADVGENRVQEAVDKMDRVGEPGVRWHLIGHLQRNKAKLVPGRFALVQSVDSLELAGALSRRGTEPLPVLLEVNVAREAQKNGCAPEEALGVAEKIAALGNFRLHGRMRMAPLTDGADFQVRAFPGLGTLSV